MVEVAVVGAHVGSGNMLQRRIGGILKNIANVHSFDEQMLSTSNVDLIVAHSYGGMVETLEEKFKSKKVIGIDLVLLPLGVRELMTSLKPGEKVGIIAEHLRCANYLMCEVIKSGIAHVHFVTGTFSEMETMEVNRFIVAEEMVEIVPNTILNSQKLLMVPRMVSPQSSAQLIHTVLGIATSKDHENNKEHRHAELKIHS